MCVCVCVCGILPYMSGKTSVKTLLASDRNLYNSSIFWSSGDWTNAEDCSKTRPDMYYSMCACMHVHVCVCDRKYTDTEPANGLT